MKIAAIISEYNPFHKGHEYQITYTKDQGGATHVIALMSGNFVQRGLPAIIDKYRRAEMALLAGIDLVLELPQLYALSSAEFFAEGSVKILNALHGVDLLSFGSEEGDLAPLEKIVAVLADEPIVYQEALQKALKEGRSYPSARNEALAEVLPDVNLHYIQNPNNILGIEYMKALKKTHSLIQPFTVKRLGKGYHDEALHEKEFASATALRKSIHGAFSVKGHVPEPIGESIEALVQEGYPFVHEETTRNLLYYRLLTSGHLLKEIPEASEGLDQRILQKMPLLQNLSLNAFMDEIKTKRYTRTRIARILMQFLIGFDAYPIESLRKGCPHAVKILAMNEKGKEILRRLRKDKELDLLHNFGRDLSPYMSLDAKSSAVYALLNPAYDPQWDFKGYGPRQK